MRIKLNGVTSKEERYLALAGHVIELAVRDAIKSPAKKSSESHRDRVAQRASEALGWMKTPSLQ